jgi:hypothetical protein
VLEFPHMDLTWGYLNFKYIYVLMLTTRTFSNLSPKCKINVCAKFKVDRRRNQTGGRRGRDRMVVGLTTPCAISPYHHISCQFESATI